MVRDGWWVSRSEATSRAEAALPRVRELQSAGWAPRPRGLHLGPLRSAKAYVDDFMKSPSDVTHSVGTFSAAALARMMRVNSTVRLLDVTANRLPEEAKVELREVAAVRGDEVLIDLGDDDGK